MHHASPSPGPPPKRFAVLAIAPKSSSNRKAPQLETGTTAGLQTAMDEMKGRLAFLLCFAVLLTSGGAVAQDVKSTFNRSVDFAKYKKYTWGSNYLLTQQPKDVQERINMAIVDSINRNLQARGFEEDDVNPDFRVTYEAGGQPKTDVGAQRSLYAPDMVGYYWGDLSGISSDVWVSSLAKVKITVTDATTKSKLWEATASDKIHDPMKFKNKLQENVDKFIQKTMKGFPPKK